MKNLLPMMKLEKEIEQRNLCMISSDGTVPYLTDESSERIRVSYEQHMKQTEKDERADWGIFKQ